MNLSFLNSGVTTDIFARLAESLLHFVWQGGVLAVMVLLADRGLRGCSAQLRYAVHVTALLLMLACVPVTYAVLERQPKGENRCCGPNRRQGSGRESCGSDQQQ